MEVKNKGINKNNNNNRLVKRIAGSLCPFVLGPHFQLRKLATFKELKVMTWHCDFRTEQWEMTGRELGCCLFGPREISVTGCCGISQFLTVFFSCRKDGVPIGYKGSTFHRYVGLWKASFFHTHPSPPGPRIWVWRSPAFGEGAANEFELLSKPVSHPNLGWPLS